MAFNLEEQRVQTQELFKGGFLHAFRDQVRLPDGKLAAREYVVHPGAVMIVPLLDSSAGATRVLLERQYRYPVQQTIIEFPAGKLDPNESSLACAQRELHEETGYSAREWARAGVLHPVVAYSTEFIDIWFARGLVPGQRKLDEGEFLEVFTTEVEQLYTWCRDGQVTDAKTLIGALWLQNVLSGAWALDWKQEGSRDGSRQALGNSA